MTSGVEVAGLQVAGEGVNASVMPLSALSNGVGSW